MERFRLTIHSPEIVVLPVVIEAEDLGRAKEIAERLIRERYDGESMKIQYSLSSSEILTINFLQI